MINTTNPANLVGATVIDEDGDKIGTVGQVYVDPTTGEPNWAAVRTGLFGTSESFVPLDDADQEGDDIRVHYSKEFVKDAPRVEADQALEDSEVDTLYRYFFGSTRTDSQYRDDTMDAGMTDRGTMDASTGYDTSGPTTDDAMTRSEERLHVGTERMETGRARLRKYVVTEDQTVTVPVSREEVRLEREPITDANIGAAMDGPDISEEEHEVVLQEERPVVQKETVPVERVRLGTETVTDEQQVTEQVRKEEIDFEGDGTTRTDR